MIRTAVALSAVACVTSLTALGNERIRPQPVSSCEHQLARLLPAPVEMLGTLPMDDEARVNFDPVTE